MSAPQQSRVASFLAVRWKAPNSNRRTTTPSPRGSKCLKRLLVSRNSLCQRKTRRVSSSVLNHFCLFAITIFLFFWFIAPIALQPISTSAILVNLRHKRLITFKLITPISHPISHTNLFELPRLLLRIGEI